MARHSLTAASMAALLLLALPAALAQAPDCASETDAAAQTRCWIQSGLGLVQSGGPLADIFEELRGAAGGLPGIGGIIGGLPPTDDIDIPTDIPTIPGGLPTNPQGIADLGRVALEAVAGRLNVPLPEGVLEDAGALGLLFTNIFSGGNFDATTLETLIAALLAAGGADLPTIPGFPLPTGRRMLRA